MYFIPRRTVLRFSFLNLVYSFTKLALICLKIITRKPLFLFILLSHTNPHFLQFLKHRQCIFIHTTKKNILYSAITFCLVLLEFLHLCGHDEMNSKTGNAFNDPFCVGTLIFKVRWKILRSKKVQKDVMIV